VAHPAHPLAPSMVPCTMEEIGVQARVVGCLVQLCQEEHGECRSCMVCLVGCQ
jgi:hypothetical protein